MTEVFVIIVNIASYEKLIFKGIKLNFNNYIGALE